MASRGATVRRRLSHGLTDFNSHDTSMSTNWVHIVPTLPPVLEGVGAYALALATALDQRLRVSSRFVVGDPQWSTALVAKEEHPAAASVTHRGRDELVAAIGDASTVLLHYVGYGYSRRGCPRWLVDGLERWIAPGKRLLIVFHEIYATGPPWTSAFWLTGAQRRLAARLARLASGSITSLRLYRERILAQAPGSSVAVLPVFCPLPEPTDTLPLSRRDRRLVVFGGEGARSRAYGVAQEAMMATCDRFDLKEIVDIGPAARVPTTVGRVPVRGTGPLSESSISELLRSSYCGFLAYPRDFLGKSTVFAAYAAYGLLPVVATTQAMYDPPAETLAPCWEASAPGEDQDPQWVTDAAREWYRGHSLGVHVAHYAPFAS
jgi:hypothetical protein